jgi:hypothetical protein
MLEPQSPGAKTDTYLALQSGLTDAGRWGILVLIPTDIKVTCPDEAVLSPFTKHDIVHAPFPPRHQTDTTANPTKHSAYPDQRTQSARDASL